MADSNSNSADPTSYIGIEISTTFYAVSGRFFLRVRISATFLFPAKVQVSRIPPISYSPLTVTMAL